MTMRFFIGVKATEASEAGEMPGPELLRAMFEFNQELVAAGVMIDGNGLQPSAAGYKILTVEGETRIVDGPFTETKELISGYWVLQANSVEEAVAWAKRAPMDADGRDAALEMRQIFELEDFPENPDEADWREAAVTLRVEGRTRLDACSPETLQPDPSVLPALTPITRHGAGHQRNERRAPSAGRVPVLGTFRIDAHQSDSRIVFTIKPRLEQRIPQLAHFCGILHDVGGPGERDKLRTRRVSDVHLGIVGNLLHLVGVHVGEEPDAAIEFDILRLHRTTARAPVITDGHEHGHLDVLDQLADFLDAFGVCRGALHRMCSAEGSIEGLIAHCESRSGEHIAHKSDLCIVRGAKHNGGETLDSPPCAAQPSYDQSNAAPTWIFRMHNHGETCEMLLGCVA